MNHMEYELERVGTKNARKNLCGSRIGEERDRQHLTVGDLEARLQLGGSRVDAESIRRIERGERMVKDYELRAIARALNVRVTWLLWME